MNKLFVVSAIAALVALASAAPQLPSCKGVDVEEYFAQFDEEMREESKKSLSFPGNNQVIEAAQNFFAKQSKPCLQEIAEGISEFKKIGTMDTSVCTKKILEILYNSLYTIFKGEKTLLFSALIDEYKNAFTMCAENFIEVIPFKADGIMSENLDTFIKLFAEDSRRCDKYKKEGDYWYYYCFYEYQRHTETHKEVLAKMLKEKVPSELKKINFANETEAITQLKPLIWSLFKEDCEKINPLIVGVALSDTSSINYANTDGFMIKRILLGLKFAHDKSGLVPVGYTEDLLSKLDAYSRDCSYLWTRAESIAKGVYYQLTFNGLPLEGI